MSSLLVLPVHGLSGNSKKRPRPPPAEPKELWNLEWKPGDQHTTTLVARLHAQQDCQVAVQGRGVLRCCRRRTGNDDDNNDDDHHEDDDVAGMVTVNGFRLPPKKNNNNDSGGYRFDCPSWSSWATLSLSAGSVVEIVSYNHKNNNNNSSSSSSSSGVGGGGGDSGGHAEPSFQVWSAHDPQARPTVIPPTWKQAVDAIENDYWQRHSVAAAAAIQQQQQQQQQHLLIHRESLEEEEEEDPFSFVQATQSSCFQVLFCGAKNVGKSTCLRYCLNRLLSSSSSSINDNKNKNNNDDPNNNNTTTTTTTSSSSNTIDTVAVLDADVGQSELGPPGMLTLSLCRQPILQQPHCHFLYNRDNHHHHENNHSQQQQQHSSYLLDAYFFGATSSQVDPTRYMEGIHKLLQTFVQYCHADTTTSSTTTTTTTTTTIPLLVNLDGWVKGLGLQVLQAIVAQHQPTHVVQILGDLKSRQFDLSLPQPAVVATTAAAAAATTRIPVADGVHCDDDGDEAAAAAAAAMNDNDNDHDENYIATTKVHVCYAYHSKQEKTAPSMSRASSSSMAAVNNPDDNNNSSSSKTPALSRMSSFAAGDNEEEDDDDDDEGSNNGDDDADDGGQRNGNDKTEATATQQQQPTVVAAHSMSLPSASLRTLRLLAYFLEQQDEQDDSLLQIWDRVGLGQTQQEGFLDGDVLCEMAHRLAAARPYIVPMETVELVFSNTELHNDICSEQGIWDAFNGSIVGLLCKEPEQNDVVMSVEQLAMLSCVGLGIVRAIDRVRRVFYILSPVPHNKLISVNVLSLANHSLTLPFEALYRGVHSEASPYMAFDNDKKKTTNVLGSEPMRSRNSIARKSLVGCNG